MAKLVASLGREDLPNIASLAEIHTQRLIDSAAITPVQQFIDQEDYDLSALNKHAVRYYTVDDQLWAMPFEISVSMLFYNKVTFREVGLDPEKPPTNLDEVRQVSEKMLKRDANGNITRSGIALDIVGWYLITPLAEHDDLYANNENGRTARATDAFNGSTVRPSSSGGTTWSRTACPECGTQSQLRRHFDGRGYRPRRNDLDQFGGPAIRVGDT
jgi:sn-glycerol 3-phosphate transport system substrate-binding protein